MLYAFVIENDRYPARTDEYRHTVALHHGSGVVDFELPTAVEYDRKRTEWRSIAECLERLVEIVGLIVRSVVEWD